MIAVIVGVILCAIVVPRTARASAWVRARAASWPSRRAASRPPSGADSELTAEGQKQHARHKHHSLHKHHSHHKHRSRHKHPSLHKRLRLRRRPAQRWKHLDADLATLLAEVSTRLVAGATVESAWRRSLAAHRLGTFTPANGPILTPDGVPAALYAVWDAPSYRRRGIDVSAVPSIAAVCRMSHHTGAPIAAILDACAEGIDDDVDARAQRDIALAGPITNARMLAFLPVLGVIIGVGLGADPLVFLTTTGLGRLLALAGIGAEIAGIAWVIHLKRQALAATT